MTVSQPDFTVRATIRDNAHVVSSYAGIDEGAWQHTFKQGLVAALDHVQPLPTPISGDPHRPLLVFVDGQDGSLGALINEFRDPQPAGGRYPEPLPKARRNTIALQVEEAIALIEEFNPGYAATVHDLLCTVILGAGVKSVSASVSHQIGIAFINPRESWTVLDMAEMLLHEAIHQAQYLDQMVRDWYTKPFHELIASDVKATSPIRRTPRPIPLVLQAAAVGTAIMDMRSWAGQEDSACEMCGNLARSLTGVKQHEDLLSERGLQVLYELAKEVAASPALQIISGSRNSE
jgi:HEXXH motif-containing protein